MLRTTLACTLGLFAISANAQSAPGVPGDLKNFVTQFVAATNARDIPRLRTFLYPKSLACITPETKDYYDAMASHTGDDPIPPDYKVSIMPVNQGNLHALESMGQRWTVQPSQELHIDYQQGDDVGGYVLYLLNENARWFYDFPCATDAAIKDYRDNAAANEAALAHYKTVASEIKDPLRSELLTLLRAHKTATATDRYHQATGQDYKTSMYVMNALKTQAR